MPNDAMQFDTIRYDTIQGTLPTGTGSDTI